MTEVHSDAGVYAEHRKELVRFANSLVGPTDAADVVSDAVLSLLRSGALANADNPKGLMYRAVLTSARSMQRSGFRRRSRERRFAAEMVTENPQLRPDVVDAVVGLSIQQRACVFLTYWEDLTPGDVGERLGISEGTVKKYLARARKRLREVLHE